MSEVLFEGYERQYSELSSNLARKYTSSGLLDGEQKKQNISEVKAGLEDAEALIRKMDLEAKSLQPSVKPMLLSKVREYKSDLNNLKSEVKRITSANLNAAARDELLKLRMAHTKMVSAVQRGRLLMSTERLNQSSERIKESRRTMLELHGVDDNIIKSKMILTSMSRMMSKNKWIICAIVAALVLAIIIILYYKLSH
ncbi:Vesicle transport v-SNARE [Macleaya cordata]|uniref:Vesicle transport v-SNARE n=1 Tax=Macleaya cordata TaxID=56857 RepID=A0A200QQ42_MACCD|nr:Vesicle transport v-SNARE [Macleaya cordata]